MSKGKILESPWILKKLRTPTEQKVGASLLEIGFSYS